MTTVEDANSILDALQSNGVENVAVKYNYWAKNSFFEKLPVNMDVDSKVGTNCWPSSSGWKTRAASCI